MMNSSFAFFLVILVTVTLDLVTIYSNGQNNLEKWALDVPQITYDEGLRRFIIEFDVDDSIDNNNIDGTLWTKECQGGGNALPGDAIEFLEFGKNGIDKASLSFSIAPAPLVGLTNVFTDLPDEKISMVEFCARFMLVDDLTGYEINYSEVLFLITYDLSEVGFTLDDFSASPLIREEDGVEEAFGVDAYLCDPSYPTVPIVDTFNQGAVVSVCVTPKPKAIEAGLLLEKINYFYWSRGEVEQAAIADGDPAGNQLTLFSCPTLSLHCSFSSMLYADFYRSSGAPSTQPSEMPSEMPSSMPSMPPGTTGIMGITGATGVPTQTSTYSNVEICEGVYTVGTTTLNFTNAIVKQNDMQDPDGGELRFGNVGTINGKEVDLVVTSTDYVMPSSNSNGLTNGHFGFIKVKTEDGNPESGKGLFEFCLVQNDTYTQVTAESFQFALFDLDLRGGTPGIIEKVTMDTSQAAGYTLYPNITHSEVSVFCENDGSAPPCDEGVKTVFEGSSHGTGTDNPTDPSELTEQQMMRSVVFSFVNRSCWTLEFNAYCPESQCGWYGGSRLLFSGGASQVVQYGSTDCTGAEERRDLQIALPSWMSTSAIVEGYGYATLNWYNSRRLGSSSDKKDGRRLQQDGVGSDIGLSIPITFGDDFSPRLKTAGGSSRWSGRLSLPTSLLAIGAVLLV